MNQYTKLSIALAIVATVSTNARATLLDRDLNNDNVTDAFYDTELNITWLRNANINGAKAWVTANAWAESLNFGGYDDWRLPTMLDTGAPGCEFIANNNTDCGYNVLTKVGATVYSEIGHLFYVTLGNKGAYTTTGSAQAGAGLTNKGKFTGFQSAQYWTGLNYAQMAGVAWSFDTSEGFQRNDYQTNQHYALAVRAGDITLVPEPQTYALFVLGLSVLFAYTSKRDA